MATKKIRLVLLVHEEYRAALRLEASRRSAARTDGKEVTMSDLIEELMDTTCARSLDEVRQARSKRVGKT